MDQNILKLIPKTGCFVSHDYESVLGVVLGQRIDNRGTYVEVNWGAIGQKSGTGPKSCAADSVRAT